MKIRSWFVPVLALLATAAFGQMSPTSLPDLVTTSGNAESRTAPDMAMIRIGVETLGKTAREAQTSTSILANRLIDAAMRVVPDRKAYQTSDLTLNPEYVNAGPNQPAKIGGYRARNVLSIRIDDLAKVGTLIDAVTAAGATNVDSISFGLKDDKAERRKSLIEAVQDARSKAEAMAAGLGLRLGDVYSIDENGGPVVRPMEMRAFANMKSDTPIQPGEVSVSSIVTVRFRLVKQ